MTGSVFTIDKQKEFVGAKEFDAIEELFGNRNYTVTGDHARNVAESIAKSQKEIHVKFFGKLINLSISNTIELEHNILKDTLSEIIENIFKNDKFIYLEESETYVIKSNKGTPIFSEKDIDDFWKKITPREDDEHA